MMFQNSDDLLFGVSAPLLAQPSRFILRENSRFIRLSSLGHVNRKTEIAKGIPRPFRCQVLLVQIEHSIAIHICA